MVPRCFSLTVTKPCVQSNFSFLVGICRSSYSVFKGSEREGGDGSQNVLAATPIFSSQQQHTYLVKLRHPCKVLLYLAASID